MTRVTSRQPHRSGRHGRHARHARPESPPETPPATPSIPLTPEPPPRPADASLGDLVRDATRHFSTLIRSEVELAKTELAAEVRKGIKGSVLFIVALAVLIFSLFFLFIAVGELLALWLPRWAAFGIVFALMVLVAVGFAVVGWRRMRSIRKPARTIRAVRDTGVALAHLRPELRADAHRGNGQPPTTRHAGADGQPWPPRRDALFAPPADQPPVPPAGQPPAASRGRSSTPPRDPYRGG